MTKEDKQLLQESRILSEILSRNIKKLKCQIFFEIVTVVQRNMSQESVSVGVSGLVDEASCSWKETVGVAWGLGYQLIN